MEQPKTDQMRALLAVATFGDASTRFKAKRELIDALKGSLGITHWRAKQIVIQWIADNRREHMPEPAVRSRTVESPQESKRPYVSVQWR